MFNWFGKTSQPFSAPSSVFPTSLVGYCSADVTKNNNTTLADIAYIYLPSRSIWKIRAVLFVSVANATPLIKAALTGTTLTVTNLNSFYKFIDPTLATKITQTIALGSVSSTTSGIGFNTVEIDGLMEVNVGGKLAVQGAQDTANASNTIFQRGSYISAERVYF